MGRGSAGEGLTDAEEEEEDAPEPDCGDLCLSDLVCAAEGSHLDVRERETGGRSEGKKTAIESGKRGRQRVE